MRKIQNIYNCIHYTPNGNMNKTCRNEKRCCIFYEEYCNDYKDRITETVYAKEIQYVSPYLIRQPITEQHLKGKYNTILYVTEKAFYKSDADIIAKANLLRNIKFQIVKGE